MCGICGKLRLDGPIDPELLACMCDSVVHRGPDSRGIFVEGGVGLGIQRLAIIDLKTGNQPIFNEDGTLVVVLNGEIYNYRALRRELMARGHVFATATDTEVLVHLYEDLGDDCVSQLRGMFAFALWDRARARLLLARDRIGKKPLYYAQRGNEFWFASEAKAILQDPSVRREPDLRAIDSFLHFQYVPDPYSAFKGLTRLPPAHLLVWHEGRCEVRRYWKLRYAGNGPQMAEAEVADRLRSQLEEATKLRLRSDVPLGAFLSGGIDSSAVVAAAARQASSRLKTFSIGFAANGYDETRFARAVARHLDTEHYEFRVEPKTLALLPEIVWHYGEPFADPSAIPSFYLSKVASSLVKVALNGDGGDENFAGYPRYVAQELARRMSVVPLPLRLTARGVMSRIGPGGRQGSLRHRANRLLHVLPLSPVDRYTQWVAFFNHAERRTLYTDEFRRAVGHSFVDDVIRGPYGESDASEPVDRFLDVDVQTYLPGDLLVKMDIASMAYALEVRSPLLDHEFMQFVADLPAAFKLHGHLSKRVFRSALRPWLPREVLNRSKMGFRAPLSEWFRDQLRTLPEDLLLDKRSCDRGFFRREQVRTLIQQHRERTADHAERIWALIMLELWMRTYIDRPPTRPLESVF